MVNFRPIFRATPFLLPPSVEQTSLLAIGAPPDMQKIKETAHKYGVEFI